MIKITFDDGEVYTEEQYKKDYIRMMDSLRTMDYCFGKKNCCSVNCDKCPFRNVTNFTNWLKKQKQMNILDSEEEE